MDDKLVLVAQQMVDTTLSNATYLIFGQIDLANSFTPDDDAAKWWQTPNLTAGGILTGTTEKM